MKPLGGDRDTDRRGRRVARERGRRGGEGRMDGWMEREREREGMEAIFSIIPSTIQP